LAGGAGGAGAAGAGAAGAASVFGASGFGASAGAGVASAAAGGFGHQGGVLHFTVRQAFSQPRNGPGLHSPDCAAQMSAQSAWMHKTMHKQIAARNLLVLIMLVSSFAMNHKQ
jgi:hypothetical protein